MARPWLACSRTLRTSPSWRERNSTAGNSPEVRGQRSEGTLADIHLHGVRVRPRSEGTPMPCVPLRAGRSRVPWKCELGRKKGRHGFPKKGRISACWMAGKVLIIHSSEPVPPRDAVSLHSYCCGALHGGLCQREIRGSASGLDRSGTVPLTRSRLCGLSAGSHGPWCPAPSPAQGQREDGKAKRLVMSKGQVVTTRVGACLPAFLSRGSWLTTGHSGNFSTPGRQDVLCTAR